MKVTHEEALLVYDCELLVQAKDERGQSYILSHTAEEQDNCEYIAVPVSKQALKEFRKGEMDLKEIMLSGPPREWYIARPEGRSGNLSLHAQNTPLKECPDLPEAGYHPYPEFSKLAKA